MKQYLFQRLVASFIMLAVTLVSWAFDFEADGIYYNINSDNTSVTVTYKTTSYNSYSGSISIPSQVTYINYTYIVTGIGSSAFRDCDGLTSLDIPNSVTSIGSGAFLRCTGLISVTIPTGVTNIGQEAFYGCSCLNSMTIPNSVINIGANAFGNTAWYNNQPNGLVYVGKIAYKYKGTIPSGTHIIFEEGTLGIADYAFNECTGITSVTIPNSVTSIGAYAFRNCDGLTSLDIPNSVTRIGSGAFLRCIGITSLIIGNGLTNINNDFNSCIGLTSIKVRDGNPIYDSRDNRFTKNPFN